MTIETFAARSALAAVATQLPKRSASVEPFEVAVAETRTGRVVKWVPIYAIPDWSQGLNDAGSWKAAVPIGGPGALTKQQVDGYSNPWYFSWVICQGMKVWQAGPVIGEDYDDGNDYTELYGAGIWKYFTDKRVLLNPDRADSSDAATLDADVVFGSGTVSPILSTIPLENRNLALASVAARLVQIALDEPGSDLPIDTAPTTIAGDTERTYAGYDLGSVGQRLAELGEVDGGPEQMFVPYFTDSTRRFLRWKHLVGNPRLGQLTATGAPVWSTNQALTRLGFSKDGTRQVHRAFERGSGMDRNTLIACEQNLDGVTTGPDQKMPLLEMVGATHSEVELADTLYSYAIADVLSNQLPELTLRPQVRIAGDNGKGQATGSPQLAQVSPGDIAVFRVRGHRRLPDGKYRTRVLQISSVGSDVVATLSVQVLSFEAVPA